MYANEENNTALQKKLNLVHSRKSTKFIKGLYWQRSSYFYAVKYICEEEINYMTWEEAEDMRSGKFSKNRDFTIGFYLDPAEFAYGLRIKK